MKPNFSMVLIARNEEKTLPRMLKSLESFIKIGGEVVIVDTGSTDNTAQIARDAGCVVEEVGDRFLFTISEEIANAINTKFSEGEGDIVKAGDKLFNFSDARNYAASLASNDMISNQDCDEEYTKLNIDAICRLIDLGHQQFNYNFVFSHDEFGRDSIKFIQSKFYDRRLLQWVGIIHEVLQSTPGKDIRPYFLGEDILKLEHWQNHETTRGSYLVGLALDCFQNPEKDRNSHYFARELMWHNKPKSAIVEFKRHIEMKQWITERAQSMTYIGDCYAQLNDPEQQVEWYHKAFALDGSLREPLIKLAYFYKYYNNPQKVACYTAAAMEIPWSPYYCNQRDYYENVPHELMYWAKGWMGDIEGAKHHILKALEHRPYNRMYLDHTQYYFEYPDNGIEGWMRFPELQWLYETAKDANINSIVEVGSWKGRSTHALCSGCRHGQVIAIDHFLGSDEEQHKGAANDDGIYSAFLKNTQQFKNLKIMRCSSAEGAERFKSNSVDMVFIDAGHTYEDVKADLLTWKDKPRILLCGHDYCNEWPGVKQAVDEVLGEVKVCDSIWYKYV